MTTEKLKFSFGNCILEFQVSDVDKEYEMLKKLGVEFVKLPTTQPWGIRSVWFKDPDGNIINFYSKIDGEKDLKDIAVMYFNTLINEKDPSICDKLLAQDYSDNDAPEAPLGPEETKSFVSEFLKQYPDMFITIKEVIKEGNKVVLRLEWKGTDKDNGEIFNRNGIIILEFNEENQIKRRWSSYF